MSRELSLQPIDLDEHGLSYSILAAQSRVLKLLGDGAEGREVAAEICRIAAERFSGVGCAILTFDAAAQHVGLLAASAVPEAFSAALAGLAPAAAQAVFRPLESGAPDFCDVMVEDPAFFPLAAAAKSTGLVSCWSAAVRKSETAEGAAPATFSGIVCLFHPEAKRPGPRGVKVLELFASLAGLAIERATKQQAAARERWIDPLTQLPGRQLFERMLRDLIAASDPESSRFALVLLDIDRFLEVNERYGSRFGDILLAYFARRLQSTLRRGDFACRLEGDCFALLVRIGAEADEASRLAGRFREEGRRAFDFDGQTIALTASLGVAVYPWDGAQGPMLLANAEAALRAARAAGGDAFRIYSASLRGGAAARADAADGSDAAETSEAAAAAERERGAAGRESAPKLEELELFWDPFFEVSSRRWSGFTARLAWRRPGGARAGASDLWRAAARAGMVGALLRWQVRNALADFVRATRDLPAPVRLTLPLPPVALASEGFVGTVIELLAGERLEPERMALEIPVQALERDSGVLSGRLAELSAQRVRLELAGVGVGNLPLEPLAEIAWSGLKLDGFLLRSARARPALGALASGLLAMARQMKMVSAAEEVDDALDLTWLGLHRCDLASGAALRRPATGQQLGATVAELRKST